MATYAEKLKDPRWQKVRLEVLQRDNFTCQYCGATDKTLHVHHYAYNKNYNPWDIDNSALQTICEECHLIEHFKDFTPLEKILVENVFDLMQMFRNDAPTTFDCIKKDILKMIKNG